MGVRKQVRSGAKGLWRLKGSLGRRMLIEIAKAVSIVQTHTSPEKSNSD